MKILKTQIGISMKADFEEKSWTFLMHEDFSCLPGEFIITDMPIYIELKSVLNEAKEVLMQLESRHKETNCDCLLCKIYDILNKIEC